MWLQIQNCQCAECKKYFQLHDFSKYFCIYCGSVRVMVMSWIDRKGYIHYSSVGCVNYKSFLNNKGDKIMT